MGWEEEQKLAVPALRNCVRLMPNAATARAPHLVKHPTKLRQLFSKAAVNSNETREARPRELQYTQDEAFESKDLVYEARLVAY